MAEVKSNVSVALGEDIFKIAVENTPTGVCITNEHGIFEYVNKAFCELYEYANDELIGINFTIVVPDEHKIALQALHDKYIDGTEEVRGEWDVVTKSGKHLTILADAVRVKGFYGRYKKVTFVTDITERRRHEQELQKFYLSIETSSASIVITDSSGAICYSNPSFCKITGYSQEDVIGQNMRIVKSGVHDQQFYKSMWDSISNGKTWRGEICNKSKSGELFWESTIITPIPDRFGKIVNYVAIKNDISEKIDLERLREDVDRILRHDLKTPLNAIVALPQLLKEDGNLTLEQYDYLDNIEKSGWRMLKMINSSLDIFKMEEGSYRCNLMPKNLISLSKEVVSNLQSSLQKIGSSVSIYCDSKMANDSDQFVVATEETNFYNMMSNLLANATEASTAGSDILVNFTNSSPKRLSITNKGVVPKTIRDHFFEKYKTYGKQHGTGLGTYSAKLIAEALGYHIEMQTSDENNETTITITFCDQ
jgi:PAS domain S-box-containing protein